MVQDIYDQIKQNFSKLIDNRNFWKEKVVIKTRILEPQEAIGNPERTDFPLLKGKERIMQADFKGSNGQAFTDMYGNFEGTLDQIMDMNLNNNYRRAIFVSTINAVMRHLTLIEGTIHCKDDDPEFCGEELVKHISANYGTPKIAFVGFQPALIEHCSKVFEVNVLDLDRKNIGKMKFGLTILDGEKEIDRILKWCDLAVVTGSTFVNGTAQKIIDQMKGKSILFYGVTVAGITELLNLDRFCCRAR
ncbi:MAG: DUF364 domain-containing protein [Candidatus Bathyarchaeia archaeon]